MVAEALAVASFGAVTGFGELIGRYRDAPLRAATTLAGMLYIIVNAVAAVAALIVIDAFGWTFGLADDVSRAAVSAVQVLVAGLGAAALFRSSLFNVQVGSERVGVGPSVVLEVILRVLDRSVDRVRARARLQIAGEVGTGMSFERDAVTLVEYCLASMQNLSVEEATWLGGRGNALRVRADLPDEAKIRLFAMDLMSIVGEDGLRAAVTQLGLTPSVNGSYPGRSEHAPELTTVADGGSLSTPNPVKPDVADVEGAVTVVEPGPLPAIEPNPDVLVVVSEGRVLLPVAPLSEAERRLQDLWDAIQLAPRLAEPRLALAEAVGLALARGSEPRMGSRVLSRQTALDELEAAIEINPRYADAYLERGRLLTRRIVERPGRFSLDYGSPWTEEQMALDSLSMALQLSDEREFASAVRFELAALAVLTDHTEVAAKELTAALESPDAPLHWSLASAALSVRLGDARSAIEPLKNVVDADPEGVAGIVMLGLLQAETGDETNAARALATVPDRIALALDVDAEPRHDADYFKEVGRGQALAAAGDAAKAVAILWPVVTPLLPGCELLRSPATLREIASSIIRYVLAPRVGVRIVRSKPTLINPADVPASDRRLVGLDGA